MGQAVAAADRALTYNSSPKIRFMAGRLFSEAGDQKRASTQAKELGSGLEVLSQAYGKIVEGNIALAQGDPRQAVRFLTEAVKIRDTWLGRFDLGRAYLAVGNAFLEAVYYHRPLVVNNYSIYESDIKPKGFQVIEFDGFISEETLEQTRHALLHPEETRKATEHNYELARRYYSFTMLERRLEVLLADCFGEHP